MSNPANQSRPVVLLTNDDGPPSGSSPNIFAFCKLLISRLGWDVRVVIPDSQKSWVGKAFAISDIVTASYFYPLEPHGLKGDITTSPRPLKEGETMEWILLSGTPATCTNIGIHNLYPNQIDLVISGPNHGRNSSTAFALSSGTLGAALAAALSIPQASSSSQPSKQIPAIAVSYGVVKRPCPARTFELAHDVSVDVCERLWRNWGYEDKDKTRPIQVYSVNVPLVEEDLEVEKRKVVWTDMWRSTYGQLFQQTELKSTSFDPGDNPNQNKPTTSKPAESSSATAGPAALPKPTEVTSEETRPAEDSQLRFSFAPAGAMGALLNPPLESLPEGSDAWAFANGYTSVTPLKAAFAGLESGGLPSGTGHGWKTGEVWEDETGTARSGL